MKKVQVVSVLILLMAAIGSLLFRVHHRDRRGPEERNSRGVSFPEATVFKDHTNAVEGRRSFSWREIETDDYKQYVENLRQIGCPEPTLEDIVIADVNALYLEKAKPRLEEVKKSLAAYLPNPGGTSDRKQIIAEAKARLEPLNTERLDLVSKLIGHAVEKYKTANVPWAYVLEDMAANEFAYLPAEKSLKVAELLRQAREQIRSGIPSGRALNPDQLRLMDEINRSWEQEIAKVLTPEEFEAYLLHSSAEARELRRKLAKVTVSDQEFRELLNATRDYYKKYGNYYTSDPQLAAQRAEDETKLRGQFNATLGDDRFLEYLKANDSSFNDLRNFSDQINLNQQQSLSLYNLAKQAELQVRMAINLRLEPEERQQRIQNILKATEEQLGRLLNDQQRAQYLESKAGRWMNRMRASPEMTPGYRTEVIVPQ